VTTLVQVHRLRPRNHSIRMTASAPSPSMRVEDHSSGRTWRSAAPRSSARQGQRAQTSSSGHRFGDPASLDGPGRPAVGVPRATLETGPRQLAARRQPSSSDSPRFVQETLEMISATTPALRSVASAATRAA